MYGFSIFHKDLLNTLINNVRNGRNANTYIFEGQPGLCKHEAAELFAKSLVCDNRENAPCGECLSCLETDEGHHPDIIHILKEKDRATLGINPIRNMITECLVTPFYNASKVFIIDDGDLLTPEAQNAFLKVIEEPPEYAVFIIVCTDAQILLQTVRSRAVTITFTPVDNEVVRNYIETNYPDETRIDFLVRYCAGIPKAADKVIESEGFEKMREEVLSLVPKLLSSNKVYAYDISAYVDENKEKATQILDLMLMYLRDSLVTAMGGYEKTVNNDKSDKINMIAAKYSPELIAKGIDELIEAKKMVSRYIKPSAAVLHAALKTMV